MTTLGDIYILGYMAGFILGAIICAAILAIPSIIVRATAKKDAIEFSNKAWIYISIAYIVLIITAASLDSNFSTVFGTETIYLPQAFRDKPWEMEISMFSVAFAVITLAFVSNITVLRHQKQKGKIRYIFVFLFMIIIFFFISGMDYFSTMFNVNYFVTAPLAVISGGWTGGLVYDKLTEYREQKKRKR